MEVTAVVLYRGAFARYTVTERGKDRFVAHLQNYSGDPASGPPNQVSLEKQGRHCTGSVGDEEFLDDIFYATKVAIEKRS